MSSLYDLINGDNAVPVHSLDIETTGLNHKDNAVFSLGLAHQDDDKSIERFLAGIIPDGSTDPTDDFMRRNYADGSQVFADKQKSSGAFDDYLRTAEGNIDPTKGEKPLTSLSSALSEVSSSIGDDHGIVLIQNAPFETESFKNALNKEGPQQITESAKDAFSKDLYGVTNSNSPIAIDPNIAKAKKGFNTALTDLLTSNDNSQEARSKGFSDATKNLEKTLVDTVQKNVNAGRSTTMDLMDVSKIYLAKLHEHGELDAGFLRSGTSVDYLSQAFFGHPEKHTALDDARRQKKILEEVTGRIESLDKNGVMSHDVDFAKNLADPTTDAKSFASTINSQLQQVDRSTVSREEIENIFENTVDRRRNTPSGAFDRTAYSNHLLNRYDEGSIEDLLNITAEHKENIDIGKYRSGSNPNKNKPAIKAKKSWKTTVAIGAASMVGLGLLSSGPRKSETDVEEQGSYDELYKNVYAGQAYADWQERNNSNKMIY